MDTLDYGVISATCHTAWYARLELRDAADLPSPQKFAAQTRMVLEEGQVVKIVEYKNVATSNSDGPTALAGRMCLERHHVGWSRCPCSWTTCKTRRT